MTAKFFIRKEDNCPRCKGEGKYQYPAWEEYWKWFESHGWIESAGFRFETDNDGLPTEEITCRTCEGQGVLSEEVDLMDVLPEILEALNLKLNVE